ncbi:MAG: hypothetical protein SGI74_11380 [Oligoflexia bacterium]|nr:hypothetical protein [Oligoflexia bacterium]
MKNIFLGALVCFVATQAQAFDFNVIGFSKIQKTTQGNVYHYSNISSKTEVINGKSVFGSANGDECAQAHNPNCRAPINMIRLTATNLLPFVRWPHIIVAPTQVVYGSSISQFGSMSFDSQWGNQVSFKKPFTAICATAAQNGVAINSSCEPLKRGDMVKFTVSIIDDRNNDGIYDFNDAIKSFPIVINSTIVAQSCPCDGSGLYYYELKAQNKAIMLNKIQTQSGFPGLTQVGIKTVRFYYVKGPEEFDAELFESINMKSSYFDIPVDQTTGNLSTYVINKGIEKGVRYYFRVALVDNSGNIGYLADTQDANPTHTAYISP